MPLPECSGHIIVIRARSDVHPLGWRHITQLVDPISFYGQCVQRPQYNDLTCNEHEYIRHGVSTCSANVLSRDSL
jgi:hypothetical protein